MNKIDKPFCPLELVRSHMVPRNSMPKGYDRHVQPSFAIPSFKSTANVADSRKQQDGQGNRKDESVPKPKRPRTAYNIYFRDQQEKLRNSREYYKMKSASIASMIAKTWKHVTPSVRVHYDQLAVQDKYRYYREKVEYQNYLAGCKKAAKDKAEASKQARCISVEQNDTTTSSASKNGEPHLGNEMVQSNYTLDAETMKTSNEPRHPPVQGAHEHPESLTNGDTYVPMYSDEAIADLALRLDADSIDFLIRALK